MSIKPLVFLIGLLAAAPGIAAHHPQHAAETAAMAAGEVRKLDKAAGKITLKHGPLDNLGMPPMTMVFRVSDPAMLDRVSVGDQVSFSAEKIGGQYTVTRIEPAK
jgi:Cu/Ag efflux protein CusF